MPYEVIAIGGVDILKKIGELQHPFDNTVAADENESNVYITGEVIEDEDISPVVVEAYDNGDEHIRSLIKRTGESKARAAAKRKEQE